MYLDWCVFVNHMTSSKINEIPCNFCKLYLIRKKPNLIPRIFSTILIYNINKIYECNAHFILLQFIQKSDDRNHYLKFSDNIRFELISDTQNTSNRHKSHESMTKDLRNTHTTRNSCRDTLLCAISYWNYHGIFTCWRWSHLVSTSNFGLLTIRQHSRATKHLSLYPQGGRSGLRRSEKDKYHQHLSKPVSTDLTVKSGLVLTSAVEKDGVQGWSM